MDYEKTGKLIQELRKEKELTQMSLADKLGVTDRAVSKWERGKSFPDVSVLRPLAETLGVSVSELLDGERLLPDKGKHPEGASTITVEEADNAAIKGIRTYVDRANKKQRIWMVVLIIMILLYIITVSYICRVRSAPVNFKAGNLEFSRIRMVRDDGSVEMIYFNDPAGEELKIQIQNFLQNEMPEPETMGRLEILPGESARGSCVELYDLINIYDGVYYDRKSYEYYTFPGINRIHQEIYDMCERYLSSKDMDDK